MSKSKVEISVVLPFYNPGDRFRDSILSILDQSFKEIEVILVDNNSDHNSREIADYFAYVDERVIVLEEKKQGVVFATEKGIQASKGKYISRMDADDIAYSDKLSSQHRYLVSNPEVDLVSCKVEYVSNKVGGTGFRYYVDWSNSLLTHDQIYTNRFVESPVINPTILFRREILERQQMYREGDFPEDYELFLRWLENGVRMAKLPEVLLEWHDGESRLTRTDKRYIVDAFFKIKSSYLFKTLSQINRNHPKVVVWGAGRVSRKRFRYLKAFGLEVEYYIDLKEKHGLDVPCISYLQLPPPGNIFVLSIVTNRGAGNQIEGILKSKGYIVGKDYVMMG